MITKILEPFFYFVCYTQPSLHKEDLCAYSVYKLTDLKPLNIQDVFIS